VEETIAAFNAIKKKLDDGYYREQHLVEFSE